VGFAVRVLGFDLLSGFVNFRVSLSHQINAKQSVFALFVMAPPAYCDRESPHLIDLALFKIHWT